MHSSAVEYSDKIEVDGGPWPLKHVQGRKDIYRILDVNHAFEILTGITKEKAVGRLASEIYGTGVAPYPDEFAQVANTGEPYSFETFFEPMNKHFLISCFSPAKGHFATMFIDIIRHKKAEEELKHSNEELLQFSYISSHDLQEPLRIVTSYLGLLDRHHGKELDAETKEYMSFAVEGATRMKDLINDLLSYTRVESRGKPFTEVDMNQVFNKAKENLGASIEASHAMVSADNLPTIIADDTQMVSLMQNLLSNGIKSHGDKPPEVHVALRENRMDWTFSVKDNGVGIPAPNRERIFDMFQRLQTREEYEGTGIGLAIVKKSSIVTVAASGWRAKRKKDRPSSSRSRR